MGPYTTEGTTRLRIDHFHPASLVVSTGSLCFPRSQPLVSRSHRAPVGLSPHGSYPPYARHEGNEGGNDRGNRVTGARDRRG